MKPMNVLAIIFLCICGGLLGYHVYQLVIITANPIVVNLNGEGLELDEAYYGELTDLLILGKRFAANHVYSNDVYNCSGDRCVLVKDNYDCENYSLEFYQVADSLGFDVEIEAACKYVNLTECHSYNIIRVPFEPQSGTFQDMSIEYPYKKEEKFRKLIGGDE